MSSRSSLEDRALSTIKRYRMLEGGERVVVSVSGGPDSVALLVFLHGLAAEMRLDLHVFHLDHMIRGQESAADARFVEELAAELGLPCRALAVDVRAEARGSGRSPQDAAREVRMAALREFAGEVAAGRIATGHTADDQVETFLMRVVQGAGLRGLGGIPSVSGPVVRPLIEVWRDEVEEYCARVGVAPRMDLSNLDPSYLRNHVRLSLVPFLTAEFGPRIKEVILREVESLALDREFVGEQAARAFDLAGAVSSGEVRLDIGRLLSQPAALQRGVLREAWARMVPGEPSLGWRHIRDIQEKVVAGRTGAVLDLPGPLIVEREYKEVVFRRAGGGGEYPPSELPVPGTVRPAGAGFVLEARLVRRDEVALGPDPHVEFARPDLELPLEVRAPRPGDRFHPLGSPGTRKLKDFFIDIKLPRAQRRRCPLVLSGGQVLWVAGQRLDERFRLREFDSEAVMLIMRPDGEYDLLGAGSDKPSEGRTQLGSPATDHEIEGTLFTEEQIRERVAALARQITGDYLDRAPLLLIAILKGAFIFLADLARHIDLPLEFDFMSLSSYGSATKTSGVVRIRKDLDVELTGRHVLIVEDIIDTGLTLSYLQRNLAARGVASVEICALLNKKTANKVDIPIKYEGFSIPDVFVVGYGLDYAERYRNLPYIATIRK